MGKTLYERAGIKVWEFKEESIPAGLNRSILEITDDGEFTGERSSIHVTPDQLLALIYYFEANKDKLGEKINLTNNVISSMLTESTLF